MSSWWRFAFSECFVNYNVFTEMKICIHYYCFLHKKIDAMWLSVYARYIILMPLAARVMHSLMSNQLALQLKLEEHGEKDRLQ